MFGARWPSGWRCSRRASRCCARPGSGEEFEYPAGTARDPAPARPRAGACSMGGSTPAPPGGPPASGSGSCPWRVAVATVRRGVPQVRPRGRTAPSLKGPAHPHRGRTRPCMARIAPPRLHETNTYGACAGQRDAYGPYKATDDVDALRTNGEYLVLTPYDASSVCARPARCCCTPLGGLDRIWPGEPELVANEVIPAWPRRPRPSPAGGAPPRRRRGGPSAPPDQLPARAGRVPGWRLADVLGLDRPHRHVVARACARSAPTVQFSLPPGR